MRRELFRMDRASTLALLGQAQVVHLASTTAEGEPLLRVLHAVVVRDHLMFHGAPVGEKTEAIGRRAVVSAEEIVASVPSYFVDPERACPATTFYRSAQLHGTIERIDDPELKAEMLAALMAKYQPEGGHVPIEAAHRLYRKAIGGVMVLAVSLEELDGKAKLGQNRTPGEVQRLLTRLWERGLPEDARAVDLVRAANPTAPLPDFLAAPEGTTLVCAMQKHDAEEAATLLESGYWNQGVTKARIMESLSGASAWVGARDATGALVGTAMAISDGARRAWIYDVMVAPRERGRGLGRALVRLLLDHPAVRRASAVRLNTVGAEKLYERFGFQVRQLRGNPPTSEMILERE